jgi:alcohol dehydrogenase class IV
MKHSMQRFTFNTTPLLVMELGAAKRFGAITGKTLGCSSLFVTDSGLRKLGLCDSAIASLEKEGTLVTVFDAVEADPSLWILMKAVEAGRVAQATGVAGFGGGSSLDVAKLAALLLGSGENLDEAWGVAQAKGPRLPLMLVPTTAGTGSEVTPVSIITVGEEDKRGVSSPIILPDIAVLDAELTFGLPPAITAATGIDAMVHAFDGYASRNVNNSPLSKMLAKEALRLLGTNIETAVFHDRMYRPQ